MNKLSIMLSMLFLGSLALVFDGCKKDESNPTSTIIVSMKDAPASFDEVNVEVIEVQVHTNQDGWITVPVTDSVYNLLLLQNNNATFLANTVIPSATFSQVRLILGSNNYVVIGGTSYPL